MTRQAVSTSGAPGAIGPYSQAILDDGVLFCSGQLGLDPATGTLVDGGTAVQAERALRNLAAVLDAAGCTFANVAKVTIFLAEMSDFADVNRIYAGFFPEPAPARSTVAVKELPLGAGIEIEAIARRS